MIKLTSETTGSIAWGEGDNLCIRELLPTETVHCRDVVDDEFCAKCGEKATVWHYSESLWAEHPQRCSGVSWHKLKP